jgi:flagellar hook protein FlgE
VKGPPGTASLGIVRSGALEVSNVELSEQLVKMISAQRNFQANAQVISTADQMTQTLLQMR